MSGGIFISYRRQETSDVPGLLADRLATLFGQERVFMDVTTIAPGVDFAEAINQALDTCQVLLAVIGPEWVTTTDSDDRSRLDDPDDIVRLEVEAALERDVPVIPVLVGGAVMPQPGELPKSLAPLARRNGLNLSHDSFSSDVARLIAAIERIVGAATPADPMPPPDSDLFLLHYSWDYGKAKAPAGDAHGKIVELRGEHLLVDPELDTRLDYEELPLRVVPSRFTVDAQLRSYLPAARRRKGLLLFDGICVRLGTDVTRELLERPKPARSVEAQLVSYYNLLCSNYLASFAVRSRSEDGARLRGVDLVVNQHGRVRPLTDSRLANVIGVSTIAITRDGRLVTGMQTKANASSAGLRAPAGSGSMDDRDLPGSKTLQQLVVTAMERELSEEVNLHGVGASSQITGYSRWLERGAKPEFVGVTVLDASANEIRGRPTRRSEEQLVARVNTHEVDPRDIRVVGNQLRGLPPELLGSASVPLLWALRALAATLELDPELVDRLMERARHDPRAAKQPNR